MLARILVSFLFLPVWISLGNPPELPESGETWVKERADLLERVTGGLYGNMPPQPPAEDVAVRLLSDRLVNQGKWRETLGVLIVERDGKQVPVRFGIIRPVGEEVVPVIIKNDRWLFDLSAMPQGSKRDQYASQNRVEEFEKVREVALGRGYAICKFVREDLARDDRQSGRASGVLSLYPEHDWGAIAAWAWGYQPMIDYLIAAAQIDHERIIATGHSRGGKAALAAAIYDERIAIAAPSASGSGGTGSWRHFTPGGARQTASHLARNHEHWFAKGLVDEAKNPTFDGQDLQALVAPRGLINTQGVDDKLANPLGTRLMFERSKPIFKAFGAPLPPATHWRPGGHGHLLEDWVAVLDYADAYFDKARLPERFDNWPTSSLRDPLPDPLTYDEGDPVLEVEDPSDMAVVMSGEAVVGILSASELQLGVQRLGAECYVADDLVIPPDAAIACFPPVSGG